MMISIHKALLNQVSEDDGVVAFLAPYGRNALTATRLPNIHQSRRLPSHLSSHCQDAKASKQSNPSMNAIAGQVHASTLPYV